MISIQYDTDINSKRNTLFNTDSNPICGKYSRKEEKSVQMDIHKIFCDKLEKSKSQNKYQ